MSERGLPVRADDSIVPTVINANLVRIKLDINLHAMGERRSKA